MEVVLPEVLPEMPGVVLRLNAPPTPATMAAMAAVRATPAAIMSRACGAPNPVGNSAAATASSIPTKALPMEPIRVPMEAKISGKLEISPPFRPVLMAAAAAVSGPFSP